MIGFLLFLFGLGYLDEAQQQQRQPRTSPGEWLLAKYDGPQTLHYVDPPYPHTTRGDDNRYRFEMADADHRQLAQCLRTLKGTVILSGYPCALYDQELFSDWHRVERSTHADGARDRVEVLWLSPGIVVQQSIF